MKESKKGKENLSYAVLYIRNNGGARYLKQKKRTN